MTMESLTATWQRLNTSVEAMAALAADLRLRQSGAESHPVIRKALDEVMGLLGPGLLDGTTPQQQANVLGGITAFFKQAVDLLEQPGRAPGWVYQDPLILQSMGQASRMVVGLIAALAERRPSLASAIAGPGRMLDVGTGVGWLAIEAARTWPSLQIVGIDPYAPSLEIARQNLATSGVADRVELRCQSVTDLDEPASYRLAWLAGPFIPAEVVQAAMQPMVEALTPGGTLIFGLFGAPPDPLAEALLRLKILRNGGHPWTHAEAQAMMEAAGLVELDTFAPPGPTHLVIGRKPG